MFSSSWQIGKLMVMIILVLCVTYTDSTTITCQAKQTCMPDCTTTSCENDVIDATKATGLILSCTQPSSCKNSQIHCPININKTICFISCDAANSCQGAKINSNNNIQRSTQSIQLECNDIRACDSASFVASVNNITGINLSCNGNYSCNALQFIATSNATKSVDISCIYWRYGCYGMKFNLIANYIGFVSAICAYTSDVCYQTNISVQATKHIQQSSFNCLYSKQACVSTTFIASTPQISKLLTFSANAWPPPDDGINVFDQSTLEIISNNITKLNIRCNGYSACKHGNILLKAYSKTADLVINQLNLFCQNNHSCQGLPFNFSAVQKIHNFTVDCYWNNSCNSGQLLRQHQITDSFTFNCHDTGSCRAMEIKVKVVNAAYISCTEKLACSSMRFNITAAVSTTTTINCSHSDSSKTSNINSACYSSSISVKNGDVSLYCDTLDCISTDFVMDVNHVTVHCSSMQSCSGSSIFASTSRHLDIECNDKDACSGLEVYCPYESKESCVISCNNYNHVCDNMIVNVPYNYEHGYLDLVCPLPTANINSTCDGVSFQCTGNNSYNSVQWIYYPFLIQYECQYIDSLHCCPSAETFICSANHCKIDCSKQTCYKKIIDATRSDELTINCNRPYSCFGSIIKCAPNNCTVLCTDYFSCNEIQIKYLDLQSVDGILSITCQGSSCINMTVFASNVDRFSFKSFGNSTSNVFHIENAGNTSIDCMYDIYKDDCGCNNNTWYISDQNIQWNCAGKTCWTLGKINVRDNVSNIEWNINGCDVCHNVSDCIGLFDVYCGSKFDTTDICYNPILSTNNCGCKDALKNMIQNFTNNQTSNICSSHITRNSHSNQWIVTVCIVVGTCCCLCTTSFFIYKLWKRCRDGDEDAFENAEAMLQK
eukprot:543925_1